MNNVLVTGAKGQLATSIKEIAKNLDNYNFMYVDINELDITLAHMVNKFFNDNKIAYCINCAAYTNVDTAESHQKLAEAVNVAGPKNLAMACSRHNVVLIHISTDFVFDGKQTGLYNEEDLGNPLNAYGLTKLQGEIEVAKFLKEHFIIRTSWLYSEHGHNFLKTMLKLGKEKNELNIVCDQIGTPTYAGDLAMIIINIISKQKKSFGLYHFSNEGVASWYDFAKAIFDIGGLKTKVLPIKSEAYPTPAIRPQYSVLDKTKLKSYLTIAIPHWRESLERCIKRTVI